MNNKIMNGIEPEARPVMGRSSKDQHFEIDINKIKLVDSKMKGPGLWSVDPGRNIELNNNRVPPFKDFAANRDKFREDVYLLYSAHKDPDKLISLLHEFNNVYIWPALAISMITFQDPADMTKFTIHKSSSTYAVPTALDNADRVWDMTSPASIPRWVLTIPKLSYLSFNYSHMYTWQNDIYARLFAKDLPWSDFVDKLGEEAVFREDLDPRLDFSSVHRTEWNGADPISSAVLAPIYDSDKKLKAMIYIAYPRPDVMESPVLFDFKCVLDMQFLLKVLSLCFE